ncbi:hypothetical protein [Terrarubrum flagellatum]|uniref:hypothetical protein n=1 Tax=Terrirubrum flagellatum TaxID=2895980 RepID=UPI003144F01C
MTFSFLAILSAVLAAAGFVAGWLGFDDRNAAFLTGGAVAIASACIVLAIAMLVRELRKARFAVIDALAARPVASATPATVMPAPLAAPAPLPPLAASAPADAVLAAVEAELAAAPPPPPAPASAPAARSQDPILKSGLRNWSQRAAASQAERSPASPGWRQAKPEEIAPAAPAALSPVAAPAAAAAVIGAAVVAASTKTKDATDAGGDAHIFGERLSASAHSAHETPAHEAVAESATVEDKPAPVAEAAAEQKDQVDEAIAAVVEPEQPATPKPPDIDTILNEIIARRERPGAPRSPARPAGPISGESYRANLRVAPTVAPPEEKVAEDAKPAAAADSADNNAIDKVEQPAEAETPVSTAPEIEPAEAASTPEPEVETAVEKVAVEAAAVEESASEPVVAEAPRDPEPVAEDAAADEPAPSFHEVAPEPELEAANAPETEAPRKKMVRSFSSGPNRYTMFDDGSIEAETPTGRLEFRSFDELRRYIDERMTTRPTGT